MNKVSSIITPQTIALIIHYEGTFHNIQINKGDDKHPKLLELLKAKDEDGIIELLLGKRERFKTYTKGSFEILKDGRIYHEETDSFIPALLSKRIIEWEEQGLPFEPLVNFHKKAIQNPNPESVIDLYDFLEVNKIAIDNDGDFIAYKKVKTKEGRLVDVHTGTIPNDIGTVVKMDREKCNDNRLVTCSTGLHICAFGYLSSFSGDTIILCKVNPKDVVSVPVDYKQQKMRVCEYFVLGKYGGTNEMDITYVKEIISEEEEEIQVEKPGEFETKPNNSNINLPSYESLNASEWVEWAAKNLSLIITTGLDKKNRIYKKITNRLNEQ